MIGVKVKKQCSRALAGMRIKASYIGLKKEIISQKGRWYLAVIIDKERVQESNAEDRRAGGSEPG